MMKKNNKKGFTLAELLIVIAIIAILIAIAIPAFSGALYSAKLQTDHGNIRSAYAIYRTAEMLNTIEYDDSGTVKTEEPSSDTSYFFMANGTLKKGTTVTSTSAGGGEYELKTTADPNDCTESLGCKNGNHYVGAKIRITYTKSTKTWKFELIGGTAPAGAGA